MMRFTHTLRSIVLPWTGLFLFTTAMTAAERPAVMTWATFETEADVAKWKTTDTDFERAAEFAIAMPPGEYAVWLLGGNPEWSGGQAFVNNFTVNAGAAELRIGLPQPGIFESVFVPAKADEDGLTVRFVPETGFVINALAVFARDDLRRARKEFAGPIEHEVFVTAPELWPKWRFSPNSHEEPAAPSTDAETERGYVLFTRPFVRNVYPDSRPQVGERFERLSVFATPGEYEPFTFSIKPLRPLDRVTVASADLVGPAGNRIPAHAIDERQVRCWPVRGH